MKKHFKTILPYAISVVLAVTLYHKWNQPVKIVKQDPIEAAAEVVKKFEDNHGQKHTTINKNANAIAVTELEDPSKVSGFVDTVSQALKIARAELNQITKAYFVIEKKNLALVKRNDSLEGEVFEYKGKYLWASFNPKKTVEFPDGKFSYRYTGDFNVVDYTKETKFLGLKLAKRSYTDFFFSDTSAYLTGNIKRITVEKTSPKGIFQLNAYGQYDVQSNTFGYGPSLGIEKGPLEIGINQVYWPRLNTWSTIVNASFTFKSF